MFCCCCSDSPATQCLIEALWLLHGPDLVRIGDKCCGWVRLVMFSSSGGWQAVSIGAWAFWGPPDALLHSRSRCQCVLLSSLLFSAGSAVRVNRSPTLFLHTLQGVHLLLFSVFFVPLSLFRLIHLLDFSVPLLPPCTSPSLISPAPCFWVCPSRLSTQREP